MIVSVGWMLSSIYYGLFDIQTLNQSPQLIHRERRTVWWHNCCAHHGGPLNPGRLNAGEEWRQVQPHSLQAFQHTTQIQHEQAVVVMTIHVMVEQSFSPKWMVIFLSLSPLHHFFMIWNLRDSVFILCTSFFASGVILHHIRLQFP